MRGSRSNQFSWSLFYIAQLSIKHTKKHSREAIHNLRRERKKLHSLPWRGLLLLRTRQTNDCGLLMLMMIRGETFFITLWSLFGLGAVIASSLVCCGLIGEQVELCAYAAFTHVNWVPWLLDVHFPPAVSQIFFTSSALSIIFVMIY